MANRTRNRRASWGSLQYDAKTRTARIRYWAEGPDGYRRRSKTIRDVTRKEAETARAALMLEHGEDAPCPTVAQVWERWVLPEYQRRVEQSDMSPRSLSQYESSWRVHVSPRWADVPCDQVRPLAVQQWLSDGKTFAQADVARKVLNAILEHAARYEMVESNVMRIGYVMPSRSTVKQADKGIWTLQQLGEVWRIVHGTCLEAPFLLCGFAGCRVGESLGVKSAEVALRTVDGVPIASVPIVRQAQNRGGITERLKTASSRRTVVMAGRAALRLHELSQSTSGEWLADNGVGGHMRQSRVTKMWRAALPPDMHHPFRNLRNSWQTFMRWELRVSPIYVEPMMGHSGKDVTGLYYDRPQADMFAEVMADAYAANPYDAGWTWLDDGR